MCVYVYVYVYVYVCECVCMCVNNASPREIRSGYIIGGLGRLSQWVYCDGTFRLASLIALANV